MTIESSKSDNKMNIDDINEAEQCEVIFKNKKMWKYYGICFTILNDNEAKISDTDTVMIDGIKLKGSEYKEQMLKIANVFKGTSQIIENLYK